MPSTHAIWLITLALHSCGVHSKKEQGRLFCVAFSCDSHESNPNTIA